ncbi:MULTISPECIES: hypothetical protein [Flavobacteriaceae]|uniref:hypothetical protein n=1 Tax=Flavobacteriaceae TaxID=49546 RepID=UPI0014908EC1|nr:MULTISPECIES: hypothetical protein [Allomuricauda]MDC6367041.1 hypothetical protein [Muricauda sp. AC10]
MKKTLFALGIILLCTLSLRAQNYKGAIGAGLELYGEDIFFEAAGKYFFADHHAGQANIGFGYNATILTALYSYHKQFFRPEGLQWYCGIGPSIILLEESDNIFALRPHIGLNYKIHKIPIVFNVDWRPSVVLSHVGSHEILAFGFGLQFAIN